MAEKKVLKRKLMGPEGEKPADVSVKVGVAGSTVDVTVSKDDSKKTEEDTFKDKISEIELFFLGAGEKIDYGQLVDKVYRTSLLQKAEKTIATRAERGRVPDFLEDLYKEFEEYLGKFGEKSKPKETETIINWSEFEEGIRKHVQEIENKRIEADAKYEEAERTRLEWLEKERQAEDKIHIAEKTYGEIVDKGADYEIKTKQLEKDRERFEAEKQSSVKSKKEAERERTRARKEKEKYEKEQKNLAKAIYEISAKPGEYTTYKLLSVLSNYGLLRSNVWSIVEVAENNIHEKEKGKRQIQVIKEQLPEVYSVIKAWPDVGGVDYYDLAQAIIEIRQFSDQTLVRGLERGRTILEDLATDLPHPQPVLELVRSNGFERLARDAEHTIKTHLQPKISELGDNKFEKRYNSKPNTVLKTMQQIVEVAKKTAPYESAVMPAYDFETSLLGRYWLQNTGQLNTENLFTTRLLKAVSEVLEENDKIKVENGVPKPEGLEQLKGETQQFSAIGHLPRRLTVGIGDKEEEYDIPPPQPEYVTFYTFNKTDIGTKHRGTVPIPLAVIEPTFLKGEDIGQAAGYWGIYHAIASRADKYKVKLQGV